MNTQVNFRETQIRNEVKNNNRTCKTIARITGSSLPKLRIASYTVDLAAIQQQLQNLNEGSIFVLGRKHGFCDFIVSPSDLEVSRIHCFIKKCKNELQIVDCSLNGTTVVF